QCAQSAYGLPLSSALPAGDAEMLGRSAGSQGNSPATHRCLSPLLSGAAQRFSAFAARCASALGERSGSPLSMVPTDAFVTRNRGEPIFLAMATQAGILTPPLQRTAQLTDYRTVDRVCGRTPAGSELGS